MVVKVDVKHVYKHPLDQVMRAHINKVFFVYCIGAHMDWYKCSVNWATNQFGDICFS